MAARKITDAQKRDFRARFEAAGLSVVQMALCGPGNSALFGVPEVVGARALAEEWVAETVKNNRHRRRRNDARLGLDAWAALAAAAVGLATLLATVI